MGKKEADDVGFRRAERKKAWLKIALTGPSGAGKTLSALYLAAGMGQRIGIIDTENGSASLYADKVPQGYDFLDIDAPYTIQKYLAAMKQAADAKFDVLIMDSISHAWAGDGGLLQQKEEMDARGGGGKERNKFANWGEITKLHEKFKAALLNYDGHLIVTMRSKQDYVLGEGNRPVKVGLAPIQREGMEYEFTLVLDVAQNHTAEASKDRTGLFSGDRKHIFTVTPDTGKVLVDWLNGGAGALAHREPMADMADAHAINAAAKAAGWDGAKLAVLLLQEFKKDRIGLLTKPQCQKAIALITEPPPPPPKEAAWQKLNFDSAAHQEKMLAKLFAIAKEGGWDDDAMKEWVEFTYGLSSRKQLSWSELGEMIKHVEHNPRITRPPDFAPNNDSAGVPA